MWNMICREGRVQEQAVPEIYYVAIDGQQVGPLNANELSQLVTQKRINKNTLAWVPGMSAWQPVAQVPAILKVIALTPPPLNV